MNAPARSGTALFIWWRVDAAQAADARRCAQALQQRLCQQHPGLQAQLLLRDDEPDGAGAPRPSALTLMETYSAAGGVDAALQQAIAALAAQLLPPALLAARHVEVFTLLAPDAG